MSFSSRSKLFLWWACFYKSVPRRHSSAGRVLEDGTTRPLYNNPADKNTLIPTSGCPINTDLSRPDLIRKPSACDLHQTEATGRELNDVNKSYLFMDNSLIRCVPQNAALPTRTQITQPPRMYTDTGLAGHMDWYTEEMNVHWRTRTTKESVWIGCGCRTAKVQCLGQVVMVTCN